MRIHRVIYAAIVVVVASTAGCQIGTPCNPACGANERCVQGTCEACGEPGETCCQPGPHFECNHGVACDNTHAPTCTDSCGKPGLPCCDGTCPGGGSCNNASGNCDPVNNVVCTGGSTPYTVDVVDGKCSTTTFTFWVNTLDEAENCATDLKTQLDPNGINQLQFCPLDTPATLSAVCKTSMNGTDTLYFWNCGAQQIAICEASNCAIDCSWTDGECP